MRSLVGAFYMHFVHSQSNCSHRGDKSAEGCWRSLQSCKYRLTCSMAGTVMGMSAFACMSAHDKSVWTPMDTPYCAHITGERDFQEREKKRSTFQKNQEGRRKAYPKEMAMGEDSPASYIRMVHHLIERCLMFGMSMEDCMEALAKRADVQPVITSTVWKELEKENKEFFDKYKQWRSENGGTSSP